MRLLRRATDPATFDALASKTDLPAHLKLACCDSGRTYFRLANPDSADHSFALVSGSTVAALVECDFAGASIGRFGSPLEIRLSVEGSIVERSRRVRDILGELDRIRRAVSARCIDVRTSATLDPDGLLVAELASIATARIEMRAEIRLGETAADLMADLRKGHRQQVRWGDQNLALRVIGQTAADPESFDIVREFHARVAGRVTRSRASWDAMRDAIERGGGSLVLGTLDGRLVAASLVLDGGDTAYYASGIYDRDNFDKPLAHATVFRSILAAKARGLRHFDVGDVAAESGAASPKERAIGFFKRGFTSLRRTSLVWTIDGHAADGRDTVAAVEPLRQSERVGA